MRSRRCVTALMMGGVLAAFAAVACGDAESELEKLKAKVRQLQAQVNQLQERIKELEGSQKRQNEANKEPKEPKGRDERIKLSGYLQGEFIRDTGEGVNRTVEQVRRARLKLDAKPVGFASLTLQGEFAGGNIEVRDAYTNVFFGNQVTLWAGQFKLPFSSQIIESSGVRLAPERALINTRLFPGERERGAMLDVRVGASSSSPVLSLGAFSGAGPGVGDNNNDKDFFAALHIPTKPWSARLAFYTGKFTNPVNPALGALSGRTVDKVRYGFDVQYDRKQWNWQLQFAQGEGDQAAQATASATRIRGWFTQLAYRAGGPVTLFLRYQGYDPDTNTGGNSFNGPLFGIAIEPERHLRYTIAYENLNRSAVGGSRNILTARVMVRY